MSMPLALLHSIPPPLALLPQTPWWTKHTPTPLSAKTKQVQAEFCVEQEFLDDKPFIDWLGPYAHLDARRAFSKLNGAGERHDLPDVPDEVDGEIPPDPSVFNDGSFSDPTHPQYSLTSAGIGWPHRTLTDAPLTPLERDMTVERERADAVELLTFLDGPTSSSSRAELSGLIVALFSSLPVHVALDSAAVLHLLSYLSSFSDPSSLRAQLPQSVADMPKVPIRKQVAFLPNSDLWLIFWRTLVTRGTQAVRLKKTKGHALDKRNRLYSEQHPELRQEEKHNDRADTVADDARAHFIHPSMRTLSALLIKRHDSYIQFMQAIMMIISRVHLASQEIRRAQAHVGVHPEGPCFSGRPLPAFVIFAPIWNDVSLVYTPCALKFSESMLSSHLSMPFPEPLECGGGVC